MLRQPGGGPPRFDRHWLPGCPSAAVLGARSVVLGVGARRVCKQASRLESACEPLAQLCVRIQPCRDNLMGGWGRSRKIVRDGGWIDYSYGKGRGDSAKGEWVDNSYWQNRGYRGSGGAKNNRPNEVVPRVLEPWAPDSMKDLDARIKAAVSQQLGKAAVQPAKAQDAKKDNKKEKKEVWCCPCGFKNFGFRADCKE